MLKNKCNILLMVKEFVLDFWGWNVCMLPENGDRSNLYGFVKEKNETNDN